MSYNIHPHCAYIRYVNYINIYNKLKHIAKITYCVNHLNSIQKDSKRSGKYLEVRLGKQ